MANNDLAMDVVFRFKTENQGAIVKAKADVSAVGKEAERGAQLGERAFSKLGRGMSTALSVASSGAGSMNQRLAEGVRTASQLGQAFVFGGVPGLALTGIALAIGQIAKQSPAIAALNQTLDQLNTPKAIQGLTELFGITEKQADALLRAAQASPRFARELKDLADKAEAARNPIFAFQRALDDLVKQAGQGVQWGIIWGKQLHEIGVLLTYNAVRAVDAGVADKALTAVRSKDAAATREQAAATTNNITALASESAAFIENTRVAEIAKNALPHLVAENKNYARAVSEAASAHRKAQASFNVDTIQAQARATESLARAEQNFGQAVEQAQINYARSLSELARGRGREIEDDARARIRIERDVTDEILELHRDLSDELRGINREAIDQEIGAKTYAEVLRIRRDAQARRDDAIKKTGERQKEINDRKAEQLTELNFQKARRDEDYAHQRALLERTLNDNRENAQRQLDDAREATQKQLADTLTAIQTRRDEENAAYEDNRKKAAIAHIERIQELTDTRTETQKIDEAAKILGMTHDVNIQKLIEQYNLTQALASAQAQVGVSGGQGPGGPYSPNFFGRGYQHGGSFMVGGSGTQDRLVPVPLAPGERVDVTPRGGSAPAARPVINVYVGNERLAQYVDYRIDRNDRGLT